MGALREQMERDMVLRGMSPRTRESYLAAVAGMAKFYRSSPDALDEAQVQHYLLHLMVERKLAWSSCNIAVSALKFFYHVTLKRPQAQFNIPRARAPQKLPQILSREEIARIIESTNEIKHRVILMLAYGAGLRVSELCQLKVSDIDSSRMSIRVEQGKGAKDRYSLLSPRLLGELRRYWSVYRPYHWLFPSPRKPGRPIDVQTAQRVFQAALLRSGISKDCSIHSLRHAFATHLLEAKVDVHSIQRLMGHGHINSTLRYFHLTDRHLTSTASPLEVLVTPPRAPS